MTQIKNAVPDRLTLMVHVCLFAGDCVEYRAISNDHVDLLPQTDFDWLSSCERSGGCHETPSIASHSESLPQKLKTTPIQATQQPGFSGNYIPLLPRCWHFFQNEKEYSY